MKRLLSQFNKNLLQIKAELLCLGVSRYNAKVLQADPYFSESGYMHGTQLVLENGFIANIPVNEQSVKQHSPFSIGRYNGTFILYRGDEPQSFCEPVKAPCWYSERIDERTRIGDIVRVHNYRTLFCVPVKKCVFSKLSVKCKFCTFPSNSDSDDFYCVDIVEEAFRRILSRQVNYEIAIGGATPNVRDFGARYYAEIVKRIKAISDFPISLEILPPWENQDIDILCDAGVDSLIMNLEIFDDTLRRKLCPGKARIPKERYYEAWAYALKKLGENKVSSVLIVGLEDKTFTLKGCEEMVTRGVMPTLIPFKPYDQCELNAFPPTNVDDYVDIVRVAANLVYGSGRYTKQQDGCTSCGGCSLLSDLIWSANDCD